MKGAFQLLTSLIMPLLLSSCIPTGFTTIPTSTVTPLPLPTSIRTTSTPTSYSIATATIAPSLTTSPSPTLTATAIPAPSLVPELARETMKAMLHKPDDCTAPCFWGIIPGQTTLTEAETNLSHLGLKLKSTTINNKDFFYGFSYDFISGLALTVTLTVTDEIVKNLRIDISPVEQKKGEQREWSAYSLETMIQHYGQPSRVDLFLGRGPLTMFDMVVYFDTVDTIVEYYKIDIGSNMRICPLSDQFDSVNLWIGNNPIYPPLAGEPLEKTTDLTLETFSQLMTGNPDQACFNLKENMFP